MNRRIIGWLSVLSACFAACGAAAEPAQIGQIATGYVYYNQAGADLAHHNADLAACMRDTDAAHIPQAGPADSYFGHALDGAALALVWNGPLAGIGEVKVENCMLVRGWRAVRLTDGEGSLLAALPTTELISRLTPWIGAQSPHGEIVRTFGNEAYHPADFVLASRPAHLGRSQLSFRVYEASPPAPPKSEGATFVPSTSEASQTPDAYRPSHSLKPEEIASASPSDGVILVRIKGISPRAGNGMIFARQKPDVDMKPSVVRMTRTLRRPLLAGPSPSGKETGSR